VLVLEKKMTHNASRPSSTDALASERQQIVGPREGHGFRAIAPDAP
jgi:hypothetical protein